MLEEKAALEGVRSHSVLELIQNQSLRWQLLTILAGFTTLQLCGINAVSHVKQPRNSADKMHQEEAELFQTTPAGEFIRVYKSRPLAADCSKSTNPSSASPPLDLCG